MVANLIASLLNKALPISALMSGLSNLSPKMKGFVKSSLAAGYGANEIVNYLRSKVGESPPHIGQSHLRADEEAAINRNKKESLPADVAQGALTTGAALGGGALGAIIGGLGNAQASSQEDSREQSKGNSSKENVPQKTTLTQRTIQKAEGMKDPSPLQRSYDPIVAIKQKHPQLGSYIEKLIKGGKSVEEISRQVRSIKALANPVKRIEEDIGGSFEDLMNRLLSGSQSKVQSNIPPETRNLVDMTALLGKYRDVMKL